MTALTNDNDDYTKFLSDGDIIERKIEDHVNEVKKTVIESVEKIVNGRGKQGITA